MARIGSCDFREKEKAFHVQEETWKATVEKERFIEVLGQVKKTTFAERAAQEGPTISTQHASHIAQSHREAEQTRPAGKASVLGC
mmetsp:Transcript_63467/g.151369  ORF Transcript_63467/g.151369 Transcript_63467/m.151369 type:complete len:85 (+) Transcript_63467:77-331(+)|eukprot:CAMPEP_0178420050 /NCGR_PEP_ID=MMETSP0689_2-20121128/25929_1 /TAXON_ID=160604 /ORGANISM="Amphidinium massartii, Strain CS-259" /LENGTH=84 /DNA_ID=CAMNT_0020041513 /DNA_START=74 /DNA_END=328 /DNA_ORIENTATION=-